MVKTNGREMTICDNLTIEEDGEFSSYLSEPALFFFLFSWVDKTCKSCCPREGTF